MSRRLLRFLLLLALTATPFARAVPAHARAAAHLMSTAVAGHCGGRMDRGGDTGGGMTIDCAIACAAMAPPCVPLFAPPPAATAPRSAAPVFTLSGVRPAFDPPPPRRS